MTIQTLLHAAIPASRSRTQWGRRRGSAATGTAGLALCALLAWGGRAEAATYSYVDWTEADVAAGTASGTITLPDASTVEVRFVALTSDGAPGNLYGAQVSGGANFWDPSAPFISTEVENPPPTPDILQLAGGQNETYTVTLSEPIKDPIMAIVSLGQPGVRTSYEFDSPFRIVSQGAGYWGGSDTALSIEDPNVLVGEEGHGTIQFIGTFSKFSWQVPTPEEWHGFTFGIRTTERLEPTVGGTAGAGGDSAGGDSAGGDSAAGNSAAGNSAAGNAAAGVGGDANGTPAQSAGAGGEADTVLASGGATHSGTGGVHSGTGGSVATGEAGEASSSGPAQKSTAGCNCSVPSGTSPGTGVAALAALAVVVARRRRRGLARR